jgi:hypothetical protein
MSYRDYYLTPLEFVEMALKTYVAGGHGDLREKAHPTDLANIFAGIMQPLGVAYGQVIEDTFKAEQHTHEEAEGQQAFDELHEDVEAEINED